jgi:hypothetical protein
MLRQQSHLGYYSLVLAIAFLYTQQLRLAFPFALATLVDAVDVVLPRTLIAIAIINPKQSAHRIAERFNEAVAGWGILLAATPQAQDQLILLNLATVVIAADWAEILFVGRGALHDAPRSERMLAIRYRCRWSMPFAQL